MPPRERERERSRRRRGPRGGDPSQLSRRERGLPTEDRNRETDRDNRHRERGVEYRRVDRGRDRERERARDSRDWPRVEPSRQREVYRALSPRQPRFPPPGFTETWETRRLPARPVSESEEEEESSARDPRRASRVERSRTPTERVERSRSRPQQRGSWRKCWVWVPEGGLSPVRDESFEREEDSREGDDIPEEEVELSVDTVTGEPRVRLEEAVEVAPEVPGGSPEVASAVDFSATEDSIARQATEAATERSASVEPDNLRERAREPDLQPANHHHP